MSFSLYSLPAVLALLAKALLFFYAGRSAIRDRAAWLYLGFLASLTVVNLAEIVLLNMPEPAPLQGPDFVPGRLYFGAHIIGAAVLLHLALELSFDWHTRVRPLWSVLLIYVPALALEAVLWSGDFLVAGFEHRHYYYNQISGDGYYWFELFALVYPGAAFAFLTHGAMHQRTPSKRLKAKTMAIGMLPMMLVIGLVMTAQHRGIDMAFNTTATLPIAITVFLAITAYAIHQYRVFDINFYIPWSRIRRRKTAFYQRINKLVGEIAALPSSDRAVHLLAETFYCPIALVAGERSLATPGAGAAMAAIPRDTLKRIAGITVRNELPERDGNISQAMARHGIAAIVPFFPGSRAGGWLLMGDAFSQQVYSRLDFKRIEQVFDGMADLFLDNMMRIRDELATRERQLAKLESSHAELLATHDRVSREYDRLRQENEHLLREQPADYYSAAAMATQEHAIPATLTLLGRDKSLLETLRRYFPQVASYVSGVSASFKRQAPTDIVVCRLDEESRSDERALARLIELRGSKSAFVLYGPDTGNFIRQFRPQLLGRIVEVLPAHATDELLVNRINSLAQLRRAVCFISEPDYPLLGRSQIFIDLIADAIRTARFSDPLIIAGDDVGENIALGAYIHQQSATNGQFVVLHVDTLGLQPEDAVLTPAALSRVKQLLRRAHGGLLIVDNALGIVGGVLDQLTAIVLEAGDIRLIVSVAGTTVADLPFPPALRTFHLETTPLDARGDDIGLFAAYYALLYNLQVEQPVYLDSADVEAMQQLPGLGSHAALKARVFEILARKDPAPPVLLPDAATEQPRSLDDYVAEFEAGIIRETLERCGGNKSKAARLLGLRPNTLHYKLERYGLAMVRKRETR